MTEAAPRVFISYSHDSDQHRDRVLELADRLRADGIDAIIDQYVQSPREGWPGWCEAEIEKANFVLMVCTEIYLRRVRRKEEPGVGHGVLWEGRLIYQQVYDRGSVSAKFVPVLFDAGSTEHIPAPVKGGTVYRVETPEGYDALLRLLTDQPLTPMPALGHRRSLPPRQRRATTSLAQPAKPLASLPHPRVEDLFVGRSAERGQLAAALFPASGAHRPVVVSGMAGVGKSYLVDRFFWEHAAQFPGGYLRLAFDPDKPAAVADLLSILHDRLKLPLGDDGALAARLLTPLTLVHLENADTIEAGQVAWDFASSLPGCALVISARLRGLGADAGWREVVISPFDTATAIDQLRAELGDAAPDQESWPALAEALGHLPLALHLAGGHLRRDHRAEAFLRRLRAKNLAMTSYDPADPTFRSRSRALLSDTFQLSLDALRREGGADGEQWLAGFSALGYAPATGFGESLGAAIAGLSTEASEDMTLAAERLSLLDSVLRDAGIAFRLHPLLAELLRPRSDKDAVTGRMTEWFLARLPEADEDQGRRWRELRDETAALIQWLALVPPTHRESVERAGSWYAILSGPYHAWLTFCEELLASGVQDQELSHTLWTLGQVARRAGDLDRALTVAEEKRDLDRNRGSDRDAALAAGLIADILQARGQLDEALKIRNEEQLPVYERLGDVRERAVTMGQIADILQARGQLDEALKIRNEEQLPVYERLGDVRERAVTMGQIADILQARGQLDEALKIRTDEELPVYERLGDVRSRAVTMGKIADILQARGQLDEALKIRTDEELPVYERLGDVHERAVTIGKIADILQARGQLDEALKIRNEEQLPVYERLGDVRSRAVTMGRIADILQARGQLDEALRILQEEVLSVYERLGDVRELLVGRANLAITLLRRGKDGDRSEARNLLNLALEDARRLNLPEAQQIEQIIEQAEFGTMPTESAEERPPSEDGDGAVQDYSADQGWEACTGLGSPDGTKLLDLVDPHPSNDFLSDRPAPPSSLVRGISEGPEQPAITPSSPLYADKAEYVVWYGTNRRPNDPGDAGKGYSAVRDNVVHHGSCRVFIPQSHKIGSIGSRWWNRLLTLTDDRLRVLSVNEFEQSAYWSGIATQLAAIDVAERCALVFVHGYNVSFEEAALRAAQIGFDLSVKGAMAFFGWPSQGSTRGYPADEATIEASEGVIADFMTDFAERSGATAVHIIAHSMGNRGVLRAVNRIAAKAQRRTGKPFGQVILAASDVDADVFRQLSAAYAEVASRTTLYVSKRDLAVEASRWLHNFPRAGLMPPTLVLPGIDTIDVTNVDLTMLGHGYVAEARDVLTDMHALVTRGAPPNERFGLREAKNEEGERYWLIGA